MSSLREKILESRRDFLTSSASGLGGIALTTMLAEQGLLAQANAAGAVRKRMKSTHFPAQAKSCIFLFMAGAPSQIDLFDPKPKLTELNGQPMPESMLEKVRFAFIKKESAVLMGSNAGFRKYGESGTRISDYLPNIGGCADDIALIRSMHTEAFNHHPGQLMMNSGVPTFGRPSMGSWINYGLGSESEDLPGYVVLTAGAGTSGGASNWTSGFLPSSYEGVLFRNQGDPVLHLSNPEGLPHECQRRSLDALKQLNQQHYKQSRDPEILSRIAAYELAYRMQAATPELIDLSQESDKTLEMYGVNRNDPEGSQGRGFINGVFGTYARNCLLARRLVERGVRFVNVYHASWDHHSGLDRQLPVNCQIVDQPVAALIQDLKQRGMLDETLVVWAAEFGRTPLAENNGGEDEINTGRDHHPFAFSVFMAGGGIQGGQVIGRTDDIGWGVEEEPVSVNDFHATILHLFGIDHLQLTHRFQGRDFRLTDVGGEVVNKLLA